MVGTINQSESCAEGYAEGCMEVHGGARRYVEGCVEVHGGVHGGMWRGAWRYAEVSGRVHGGTQRYDVVGEKGGPNF